MPMRVMSSLPTSAVADVRVAARPGGRAVVRLVEHVERGGDEQAALVHALALLAVLVVHQLVLVERQDRVAPGREVLGQVGVAAVVALEDGAVRRAEPTVAAARGCRARARSPGDGGRAVGRVVQRAAQLERDGGRPCAVAAPPEALGSWRLNVPAVNGSSVVTLKVPRSMGSGAAAWAADGTRAYRAPSSSNSGSTRSLELGVLVVFTGSPGWDVDGEHSTDPRAGEVFASYFSSPRRGHAPGRGPLRRVRIGLPAPMGRATRNPRQPGCDPDRTDRQNLAGSGLDTLSNPNPSALEYGPS